MHTSDKEQYPEPVLLIMPTDPEARLQRRAERNHRTTVQGLAVAMTVLGALWCALAVWAALTGAWLNTIAFGTPGVVLLLYGVPGAAAGRRGYLSHASDGRDCVLHAGERMDAVHQNLIAMAVEHDGEETGRTAEIRLLLDQAQAAQDLARRLRNRAGLVGAQPETDPVLHTRSEAADEQ